MRAMSKRWPLAAAVVGLATWVAAGAIARTDPPAPLPIPEKPVTPAAATDPAARQEPAVSLDWSGPATARVNKPAAYTLTVKNTSAQFVQKVVVQVRGPKGGTVTETSPAGKAVDGVHLWELGTLEPGESRPLTLTVKPSARGELNCQAWVTFTGTAGMTARVQEPKIEARVEAPARVVVGDTFQVRHLARNAGDCAIDGAAIEVRDTRDRPDQMLTGKVWDGGRLAPGEERAGNPVYVTPTAPGRYEYETIAVGADGLRATAKAVVEVIAPRLDVTVAGPAERLVGRRAAYTVTVRNPGELPHDFVNVLVTVPAGFRDAVPLDGGKPEFGKLVWQVGPVAPGEVRQVRYEATAAAPGDHGHTAEAVGISTHAGLAPGPRAQLSQLIVEPGKERVARAAAECRTKVDGIPALRVEVVDLADPVEKGQDTTYEVKITNTGTKAAADVRLVCELPAELRFVRGDGPTGPGLERVGVEFDGPNPGGTRRSVAFDPVDELAPKTEAVFRVTVKAAVVGDARFKAVITSAHLSAPVVKEESTRVYGE